MKPLPTVPLTDANLHEPVQFRLAVAPPAADDWRALPGLSGTCLSPPAGAASRRCGVWSDWRVCGFHSCADIPAGTRRVCEPVGVLHVSAIASYTLTTLVSFCFAVVDLRLPGFGGFFYVTQGAALARVPGSGAVPRGLPAAIRGVPAVHVPAIDSALVALLVAGQPGHRPLQDGVCLLLLLTGLITWFRTAIRLITPPSPTSWTGARRPGSRPPGPAFPTVPTTCSPT